MKIKLKQIFAYVLVTVFLASTIYITTPVHAAGTVNIVNAVDGSNNLNFTSAQKSVGDTFVLNLTITDAVDITSWQVGIQWDPALLDFDSFIVPTDHIFATMNPVTAGPDASIPGLAIYGAAAGYGKGSFNGTGRLAQLTLKIKQGVGAGQSVECNISFEGMFVDTFILDRNGGDVTSNYTFNIAHYIYSGPAGPAQTHDIAVTNVAPSSTSVIENASLNINVTVANNGDFTETFDAGVKANGTNVALNQTVTNLASHASTTLTFVWNTTTFALGSYSIVAIAGPVAGETNTADNSRSGGIVQIVVPSADHDVAVTNVAPINTAIGQGFTLNVSVTVANNGLFTETFDVAIKAINTSETQAAPSQTVTDLNAGQDATLVFQWNTTGWTIDNYTLSATATPVPGEPNTADNTLVFGNINVMLPGDANGDGIVNMRDINYFLISQVFNSHPGMARYNPQMDVDASGRIDTRDLLIIAINFNKKL
ncbi:MAG TPA: CARDB domain-containing protein [Patescibacteria group bacterium]|nr:CARDB domain-containing protein [Patescibacteria group bacterium]